MSAPDAPRASPAAPGASAPDRVVLPLPREVKGMDGNEKIAWLVWVAAIVGWLALFVGAVFSIAALWELGLLIFLVLGLTWAIVATTMGLTQVLLGALAYLLGYHEVARRLLGGGWSWIWPFTRRTFFAPIMAILAALLPWWFSPPANRIQEAGSQVTVVAPLEPGRVVAPALAAEPPPEAPAPPEQAVTPLDAAPERAPEPPRSVGILGKLGDPGR